MADVSTRIKHDERERMTMLEFCEFCRKEKKREKKHTNKKKKKRNEIKTKPRKKEEIFSSYFFFGMKRKSRTWQSYEKDSTLACSRFVRVHVCLARRRRKEYLYVSAKRIRTIVFACLFFFLPFSFNRAVQRRCPGHVCRVSRRPRPDLCGVAYAWEREGVNIIINNVI